MAPQSVAWSTTSPPTWYTDYIKDSSSTSSSSSTTTASSSTTTTRPLEFYTSSVDVSQSNTQYPNLSNNSSSSNSSSSNSSTPLAPTPTPTPSPSAQLHGNQIQLPAPTPSATGVSETKWIIIGSASGAGLLVLLISFITILCCCRKRRRTKNKPTRERRIPDRDNRPMTQVGHGMITPGRPFGGDLTAEDVASAVVLSRNAPPIPPRPDTRASQPVDRPASSRWGSDDSEYDMVATDGSSITRTLSTRSMNTITSERISTVTTENPFDHPAYTVTRPSRRPDLEVRTAVDRSTTLSTLSPLTLGTTETWWDEISHGRFSSPTTITASEASILPGVSRPTLSLDTRPRTTDSTTNLSSTASSPSTIVTHSPAPTYSSHTPYSSHITFGADSIISESTDRSWSQDGDLGSSTVSTRPSALSRGTTFIQHADSQQGNGAAIAGWRQSRRPKEVHLPPSYGQVYGDMV